MWYAGKVSVVVITRTVLRASVALTRVARFDERKRKNIGTRHDLCTKCYSQLGRRLNLVIGIAVTGGLLAL